MSLFPKFVKETIPPAKVANPAKQSTDLSKVSRFSKGGLSNIKLDGIQIAYFELLKRYWSLDDDSSVTMDEARRIVDRLDALYQELHQAGRKVPIRLPIEKNRREAGQKEMAL